MSLDKFRDSLSVLMREGILNTSYLRNLRPFSTGVYRGKDHESFESLTAWSRWLDWASVLLTERDYQTAITHALRLAPILASTDYGSSRQRDLGQLWTDTTRGFLGEIAFTKWLHERFGISAELDFRRGQLQDFLPSDIENITKRDETRSPNMNISIKTTKLNGIWLDIPGAQINHSDIFVMVRIGVDRDHFVAFLKSISVIRDKILTKSIDEGIIDEVEKGVIYDSIPSFRPIPAYIVGFFDKRNIDLETPVYTGRLRGRKHLRISIDSYMGKWNPGNEAITQSIQKHFNSNRPIEFESIGSFSKTDHYIVNSGLLKRRIEDWTPLVEEL